MLRRAPVLADGKAVDRFQESNRVFKAFKPPTSLVKPTERAQPARKRKRVSYAGQDKENDSDDDDDPRKKRRKSDGDRYIEFDRDPNVLAPNVNRSFPVYAPKKFDALTGARFAIPEMRNAKGELVPVHATGIALGIRPQAVLIPRPLHDPMADLAIVLYDPTVDDRETDEERRARLKEEERERERKEAEDKTKGMWNPHKSLRAILGEDKKKDGKAQKVPVVIDPVLTKVLRPHQVEGVKVCVLRGAYFSLTTVQFLYRCTSGMMLENQYGCVRGLCASVADCV